MAELFRLEVIKRIVTIATAMIISARIHQFLNKYGVLAAGTFTVRVPDCPLTSMLYVPAVSLETVKTAS